jgi:hypothetical protein
LPKLTHPTLSLVRQEQEQEQEQEEEQEQEQELEVDLESAESQTYSKEDQATRPWLLSRLQQAPAEASHGFYKARQLTTPPLIHDTLEFPESLLVSANHTRRDWREAHRLKNVVMLMEYVPEARDLSSFISEEHELTASQQQAMAAAFELYGGGGMGRAEVVHFLETMGWDGNVVEEDGIPDKVLAAVKAGKVSDRRRRGYTFASMSAMTSRCLSRWDPCGPTLLAGSSNPPGSSSGSSSKLLTVARGTESRSHGLGFKRRTKRLLLSVHTL